MAGESVDSTARVAVVFADISGSTQLYVQLGTRDAHKVLEATSL